MSALVGQVEHVEGVTGEVRSPAAIIERNQAFDIAKGIGIILVVFGHSLIGVQRSLDRGVLDQWALLMIYAFHMPLFFAVSGAFSASTVRQSWRAFFGRIGIRIAYPYFLWSAVILTAHYFMSAHTNTVVTSLNYGSILVSPPAIMWFLYVLFLAFIARKLMMKLIQPVRLTIAGVLFIVGCLDLDIPRLGWLCYLAFFLMAAEMKPEAMLRAVKRPMALVASGATLVGTGVVAYLDARQGTQGYGAFSPPYIPAAFAGTALVLAFSESIGRASIKIAASTLAYIGRRTMPIYVVHILLTAGVRIALVRLGIDSVIVTVAVAALIGLIVPIVMYEIAERLKLARLAGWK